MARDLEIRKHRRCCLALIITACLLELPVIACGVWQAAREIRDGVRLWLPTRLPETRQYQEFLTHFGNDDVLVVTWPGCALDDQRQDRVVQELRRHTDFFTGVVSGREVLADMIEPPARIPPADARERLRGIFCGVDGDSSGLLVTFTEQATHNRALAMRTLSQVAADAAEIPQTMLRLGGPAVDSFVLEQEAHFTMDVLIVLSAVAGIGLAWACLRNLHLVVLVAAMAGICAGNSIALVSLRGDSLNLILLMMPALTYVLGVSGAVHVMNYYREALNTVEPAQAAWRAAGVSCKSCIVSFLTTSAGMLSLALSSVVPVRMFGLYSAISVLLCLPVLLILLPALLFVFPPRRNMPAARTPGSWSLLRLERLWADTIPHITGRCRGATCVSLALLLLAIAGLPRLSTTLRIRDLFSQRSQVISEYEWIEKHLGPLAPVEVVVRFASSSHLSMLERVERVRAIQARAAEASDVGGGISAATFVPDAGHHKGIAAVARKRLMAQQLLRSREKFIRNGLLCVTEDSELWRISLRIPALAATDSGLAVQKIRDQVQDAVRQFPPSDGISVEFTGLAVLIHSAQRELLRDLGLSVLSAFLLIALAMMVLLRSAVGGLIAMIPNVFPVILTFGTLGWLESPVGIGGMMAAGLSLGVTVDNEIHFLNWYRRGLQQGLSTHAAINLACRHCCGAMLQATLICSAGLLAFMPSIFLPVASFGGLMCLLLWFALGANLLLLPALLAGRWGCYMGRHVSAAATARHEVNTLRSAPGWNPCPQPVTIGELISA